METSGSGGLGPLEEEARQDVTAAIGFTPGPWYVASDDEFGGWGAYVRAYLRCDWDIWTVAA